MEGLDRKIKTDGEVLRKEGKKGDHRFKRRILSRSWMEAIFCKNSDPPGRNRDNNGAGRSRKCG